MIRKLFGDIKDGRMNRLAFLGYWALLTVVMIGFGLALVSAISAGEVIIGGDLTQAQDKLRGWFTLPTGLIVGLVSMTVFFAHLNISAKRLRDIGLPGWWVLLGLAILGGILSTQVSTQASNALSTIVLIILLLMPGGFFGRRP